MAKNIIESVETKNVGFGPILHFYFEKCNIAQIIDENVPLDPRRKVLTHGEAGIAMITGYESQLYRDSLNNWHTYSFQATTHHGMATEWIWMNYPPPVQLHDYRYLGNNFRELEKIKYWL